MPEMSKYRAIFNLSFVQTIKNYKALVGLSIFLITCLIIFAHLWKITATKSGLINFDPVQLLWYIAFNEWVIISIPDIQDTMENDLRSGRLAYFIPKPISYLGATFAEALGTFCANLFWLGCVTFSFTWLQTGALPFHPLGIIPVFVFALMAGFIGILFRMLIGLSAFWLQEVDPFFWIWEKLLFMLGGLMLPMAAYPEWLQFIANLTPFPAILGQRSALAFDFNLQHIFFLTSSLIIWGILGTFCLVALYRKGLRILNMERG